MAKFKIPKIVGFLMLMAILFGAGYLFPYSYVLGKVGLLDPDIAERLAIYSDIIIFGFAMILLYGVNYFWKQDDKYGNNIGIYNKEETSFKNYTYPQITFLSVIFFMGMFTMLRFTDLLKNGFFGLKILPMQFQPLDSLLVNTAQIPVAENFMAGFTIGLICLLITFFSIKYNVSKENHRILKYFIVVIGLAIFGILWHLTVYKGSDIKILVVGIFWGLGALISLLTGFFIPFVVLHATNNFFIDFGRLYSSDFVFGFTIFVLISLIALYGFIYRKNGDWWKGANR